MFDGPMSGFDQTVRYFGISVVTALVSAVFILCAVLVVVTNQQRMPAAVRSFIFFASLFPLWFVLSFFVIPFEIRFQETVAGIGIEGLLSILISAISFLCLLRTMVRLSRTSGPGVKISVAGCIVLAIVYLVQFGGLLSGLMQPM